MSEYTGPQGKRSSKLVFSYRRLHSRSVGGATGTAGIMKSHRLGDMRVASGEDLRTTLVTTQ